MELAELNDRSTHGDLGLASPDAAAANHVDVNLDSCAIGHAGGHDEGELVSQGDNLIGTEDIERSLAVGEGQVLVFAAERNVGSASSRINTDVLEAHAHQLFLVDRDVAGSEGIHRDIGAFGGKNLEVNDLGDLVEADHREGEGFNGIQCREFQGGTSFDDLG